MGHQIYYIRVAKFCFHLKVDCHLPNVESPDLNYKNYKTIKKILVYFTITKSKPYTTFYIVKQEMLLRKKPSANYALKYS